MQNDMNKKRILIVDDDADILITYKKGLEENGIFEVDTFADPEEHYQTLGRVLKFYHHPAAIEALLLKVYAFSECVRYSN
jgi:DNA-binding response OmpR family regulator